jgi:cytochrome c biogenesis protein CcmG, thiol:disulfide interchange protein DsbE
MNRKNAAKKTESDMTPRSQRFFMALVVLLTCLTCVAGCEAKPAGHTGEQAPEIAGIGPRGEPLSLGQLRGSIVVLCFWTNSCCSDRLKRLEPYYRQNKDKGLVILAINEGNAAENVASYMKANSLTFPVLTDEGGMTAREYGVFGFPTIFIIDRKGIIRKKILGEINPEQLDMLVKQIARSY